MRIRFDLFQYLLVLVAMGSLGACQRASEIQDISGPEQGSYIIENINQGVSLQVTTNGNIFLPGEEIIIELQVRNLTNDPIPYTLANIGDPKVEAYLLETPYTDRQYLCERGCEPYMVQHLVSDEILAPGQVIMRELVWDQALYTYPDHLQAPDGIYTIRTAFLSAKITFDIEIRGAGTIITPEQALDIASQVPEVQEWIATHSGPGVTKIEDGIYFWRWHSEWVKISRYRYDELQDEEPANHVMMVAGNWEVRFMAKMGDPPNVISVTLDAISGQVMETETEP